MTQYAYDPYLPAKQTNGLGVAGFIVSLVGLVGTGGLLCPIGLILSIAALGRQPRGFAIAGLIIGLIGTCGGLIAVVLFGAAILAALGIATVAAFAFSHPEKTEITTDMLSIAIAVEQYREKNQYLPAGLELLTLDETKLTDPWGQRYQYVQKDEKKEFDLVTAGEDKTFETKDDVRLSEIGDMWAMTKGVHVSTRSDGGAVKIDLGGSKIDIQGDDNGGSVKVNVGGRTIEVTGDDESGAVDVNEAPAPPDSDQADDDEPEEVEESPVEPG